MLKLGVHSLINTYSLTVVMFHTLIIWILQLYFRCIENCGEVFKVLKIKYSSVIKSVEVEGLKEVNHLALRMNDGIELNTEDLIKTVRFASLTLKVKHLTIIAGNCGFEREIEIERDDANEIDFSYNFKNIHTPLDDPVIKVNVIDCDSKELFLHHLKETINTVHYDDGESLNSKQITRDAIKTFTSTLAK